MKRILTNEANENLNKDGYVKTPFLSSDDLNYLSDKLTYIWDDYLTGNGAQYAYFSQGDADIEKKKKTEILIKDVFSPKIEVLFHNYKILGSWTIIKQPNGGYVGPHQHSPVTDSFSNKTFVLWCPLVDTDSINGKLHIVENSQKIIPGVIPYAYQNPYCEFFEDIEKISTPLSVKAGECVIFDDNLLHWSEVNKSSKSRMAIAVSCIPKDISPIYYHFDAEHPEYFEAFLIDDAFAFENTFSGQPIERPEKYESIGFVKNENIRLSAEEFMNLLESGEKLIPEINLIPQPDNIGRQKPNLWNKIKNRFRQSISI